MVTYTITHDSEGWRFRFLTRGYRQSATSRSVSPPTTFFQPFDLYDVGTHTHQFGLTTRKTPRGWSFMRFCCSGESVPFRGTWSKLGPVGAGIWSSWLPISFLPIPFSEPANLTSLLLCGMYIAYQQPVEYNLAVAREALKHVHTTQRLQPPTSVGAVFGTYGTLRARTRSLGYWCEVVRSGEYTCLGVTLSKHMAFFKCVSFLYVSFSSLPLRAWSDRITARSSSTFSYQPRTSIRTSSFQEVTYCKVCTRR